MSTFMVFVACLCLMAGLLAEKEESGDGDAAEQISKGLADIETATDILTDSANDPDIMDFLRGVSNTTAKLRATVLSAFSKKSATNFMRLVRAGITKLKDHIKSAATAVAYNI